MRETVAIIGTGSVGAALGVRLAGAGHLVRFGVRSDPPSELAERVADVGGRAEFASPREAAASVGLVFLAVPADSAIEAALALALTPGKILIDCTNPVGWERGGPSASAGPVWNPPPAGSITAALAERLPDTRVLKAFNGFGAEFHADPNLGGVPIDVFIAGDDTEAKQQLSLIARGAGFSPIDAGPLRNAAVLENLAALWIHLASVGGRGRAIGFKLLER